ncbi:MAG: response regulator [Ardenticatenaceae bacterium]|nr:response regulator [Ardenticatenaceae bacterium]MCB9444367.1 response regulator [Ardenticatenaceae bacterium]
MAKAKILVVDDEKMTVSIVTGVLKKHGYEVYAAYNGVTGLEKAKEVLPDLIILDIMMPLMDGYEVSYRLKNSALTAKIPVLMLTAKGGVDDPDTRKSWEAAERIKDRLQGFDSGAVEFVTKPIKASDLVKRVKFILWSGGMGL